MDAAMQDEKCKQFFEDNYIIAHLTVEEINNKKELENPGGNEVKLKYHGDEAGLPFWIVLDKDGKLLADSYMRKDGVSMDQPGENIGCPSEEKEVAAFIDILKKTSRISQPGLDIIAKRFRENKTSAAH